MAVHVKRKGRRRVPEIVLHGLHIVAILERQHGEGVPQIVDAAGRCSQRLCKMLVPLIKCGGCDAAASSTS